jgi:hypothetical protein
MTNGEPGGVSSLLTRRSEWGGSLVGKWQMANGERGA